VNDKVTEHKWKIVEYQNDLIAIAFLTIVLIISQMFNSASATCPLNSFRFLAWGNWAWWACLELVSKLRFCVVHCRLSVMLTLNFVAAFDLCAPRNIQLSPNWTSNRNSCTLMESGLQIWIHLTWLKQTKIKRR
jgi:hypothetical protein